MSMTPGARNSFLSGIIGQNGTGLVLTNCYIGLSTTTPNADGTNFTEPSGSGYARAIIGLNGQSGTYVMDTQAAGSVSNKIIIFFPEATGSWGQVTYFGLFTSASGGTPLIFGALSAGVTVPSGYVALFRVGNLTLSIS